MTTSENPMADKAERAPRTAETKGSSEGLGRRTGPLSPGMES